MHEKNDASELRLTRLLAAPRQVVWEAWTDPEQIQKWWGPRGFTLTTHSRDLRSGGSWVYTMHGPDGTDYPNITKYLEVEKYQRLVYDHGATEETPALFRVTVQFSAQPSPQGEKTKMDMSMRLSTPEAAAEMKKFIKQAGGDATWDRLAEHLAKRYSGKEKFVINRTFEAPIELVFDAWTQPERVVQWLPPMDFDMTYVRADIKTGGNSVYRMSNGQGITMYGRADYVEITRPRRLVYTQQFCDENEKVSRHPMAPTWPETMLTVVTFEAESAKQTRVTVEWEPYGTTTSDELETFIKGRGGMTQGWTGSFDKLDAFLAEAAK